MQSLNEWCFEFDVFASESIPRAVIDASLEEAIGWAEAHSLGIGGGYRPASPEVADAAMAWRFKFGLCVQTDNLLIPRRQAVELLQLLQSWCDQRSLSFAGGFREFSPSECGIDNEPGIAPIPADM